VIDRRTGNTVGEELLRRNCALVKYVPANVPVVELAVPRRGLAEDPRAAADALPKVAQVTS
jgi:hypothetical protein